MNPPDDNKSELQFPLMCHYRVISLDFPNIHFVIETVLMQLGVTAPLQQGNSSSTGKYISTNVDIEVDSKEMMEKIHNALCAIEGVKRVL